MILDKVLDEAYSQFDSEDMTDSFVEGFLYAMELQESGGKLRDIDEFAETLNEISANYITDKVKKGMEKARWHHKASRRATNGYINTPKGNEEQKQRFEAKQNMHRAAATKLRKQSARIMTKLVKRTMDPKKD